MSKVALTDNGLGGECPLFFSPSKSARKPITHLKEPLGPARGLLKRLKGPLRGQVSPSSV